MASSKELLVLTGSVLPEVDRLPEEVLCDEPASDETLSDELVCDE